MTCTDKGSDFPYKTSHFVFLYVLTIALLSPALLFAQPNPESAPPDVASENWHPLDSLEPQLQSLVAEACCGLYLDPQLPPAPADGAILITAQDGEFDGSTNQALVSGGIDIRYSDTWLQGDQAFLDQLAGIVELEGNIRLLRPGLSIGATSAVINTQSSDAELQNTSYVLHELAARGTADSLSYRNSNNLLSINQGTYTVCEPGDNSWLLAGQQITLDQESGRGVGRDITLRIRDIPVFYTPYISFPITDERSSGLLYPSIGSTREGGFDFALPYYFNLAPNYDATLTPRLMTERGLMLGLEGRHLGTDSSNTLEFNYLHDDAQFDAASVGIPGSESPPQAKRWQISYLADAQLAPSWSARANYSAVSDFDYFQDFGNDGLTDTTRSHLYRNGEIAYWQENWQVQAALQSYQQIDPALSSLSKPYSSLPRLSLNVSDSFASGWRYQLGTEYVYFDRNLDPNALTQTQINNGALVSGQRFALEPSLSWRWETPGMYLMPKIGYEYARYDLQDQALGTAKQPERGVASASLDSGLVFEREVNFQGGAYTQTLEPRLYYLYRDYENQQNIPLFDTANLTSGFNQLFRDDRFSGRDRVGDANQLTLGLSSRFLNQQGQEKARFSLGQIFYFADRRVGLNPLPASVEQQSSSALAGELSWQFNENWRLGAYQEWNPDNNDLQSGSFQFRYQSDINQILNFSYRYRDTLNIPGTIQQTDISALWPLTDSLSLIARWNVDHENDRTLESIIGMEYSSCCWNVRLLARQWLDNTDLSGTFLQENNGIFLQFELKGLGNILGNSIDTLIGESISGYKTYVEDN